MHDSVDDLLLFDPTIGVPGVVHLLILHMRCLCRQVCQGWSIWLTLVDEVSELDRGSLAHGLHDSYLISFLMGFSSIHKLLEKSS